VDIGLLLATAVAATWWRTGTSWWRILHLCLAVALVVSYARLSAPAFGLVVPLAAEAAQWLAHGVRRSSGGRDLDESIAEKSSHSEARLLMIGALSVLIVATVAAPLTAQHQRHTPTRLTATLGAIPPGSTVFNDYNVASWMLFHYPDLDLVVDTRLEVFDASYVRTYESALNSSAGWAEVVARTGADWAVLRAELPLARSLSSSGWSTVKTADGYVVLHRGPQ
jgi:hypothetical protein